MARHKPYSMKPELVRGCTMRCIFCSLRHTQWAEQEYKFMEMSLWRRLMDELSVWLPRHRLEIANRGEPTLHPNYLDAVAYARQVMPWVQIMTSTNTDLSVRTGLDGFRKWVTEAMRVGVNVFLLDCYTPKRLHDITETFAGVANLFFDNEKTMNGFNPYPYRGPDFKAIVIKDATFTRDSVKQNVILHYHNQGGNVRLKPTEPNPWHIEVPDEPVNRMCTRPFREFSIWYDGRVPICCDDWNDKAILGRFPEQSLDDLWNNGFDPYRADLVQSKRVMLPCRFCTEGTGKRFGLELNWFGDRTKPTDTP